MKLELLVIADKHAAVKINIKGVLTARQAVEGCTSRSYEEV